jgi:hypothetical protein
MQPPPQFRKMYLIADDIPYRAEESSYKGTHPSQGVLHKGRVVWLERKIEGMDADATVSAYAEGVGVVLLAARHLQSSS